MTREEPRSFKNSMTSVTTKHVVKMILPSRTGVRLRNTATGNSYCRMEATGHAQALFNASPIIFDTFFVAGEMMF